ncbi:uncharacterized protein N7459_008145 [Penicillium hispanicum]|uniref:uncharacterized protein n=1 Tax=Penicillium hispanicum TaxID=1080232 RepID=UPI002540BD1A|nr:uncharacterized protein N7459_008145 [Penicillium hispanicum]KAJ5573718.1 hypothetical protein N7459_008145 [Penicillium hispanicum]
MAEESVPTLSRLDIKNYLFADEEDNILSKDNQSDPARASRKEEIFQTMIQPDTFFLSILGKDRAFGADVVHATSSWNIPLQDLISHDIAVSFDRYLVWHRFFLPTLPTLVSIRDRLELDEPTTTNCATRLLFASLALSAFELSESLSREDWRLKQNLQQAVSFFGQEFIFSPPTHQDSIVVSLFLSEYKPTAMATMQGVAHKTLKSELYINIAFGVFHRLEALNQEGIRNPGGLDATDDHAFEKWLFDSIQAFHIITIHAKIDGLINKPLGSLQHLTDYMKARVDAYQTTLETRQCTPQAIHCIQWAKSTCILFEALTDAKKGLSEPGRYMIIAEETERKCLEQIEYTNFLLNTVDPRDYQEILPVRSLLQLRFSKVRTWGIALAFLYTSTLGIKERNGEQDVNSDISRDETICITSEIANTLHLPEDQVNMHFKELLSRFGNPYPEQLKALLEMFLECTKMKLNGISFRPPPRSLGLECATVCKHLLENNIVRIRSFGQLRAEFPQHLDLFKQCAQQLATMASSPRTTTEGAFASGCLYALCSKVIFGFLGLMEKLKQDFGAGQERPDLLDAIIESAVYQGFSGTDFGPVSDNLNMSPFLGTFGQMDIMPTFDWSSSMLDMGDSGFQGTPTSFGDAFWL